jgi:hypothetical protein
VSPGQTVTDYASLAEALRTAGSTVREMRQTTHWFFSVPRRIIKVEGEDVYTFEFPTKAALEKVRSSIGRDGYSIPIRSGGIAMVEWVASPHWYSAGRLVMLYLGKKKVTLHALTRLLGPTFAGS